jgi:hypothetical protein
MLTYTGKVYWPADPSADDVCIEDIAHGLSMLCRYCGQCQFFYSVAEHSVYVSRLVPQRLALEGLLHDAAEAYCSDIVRPLKKALLDYQQFERLNDEVIRWKFGLPHEEHPVVKDVDTRLLVNEYAALFPPLPRATHLESLIPFPNIAIHGWAPGQAERLFLAQFKELYAAC